MENKLNIAELLKDCPQGMELDCVLYDDVTLECVSDDNCYPIKIHTPEYNILLNKYGCLTPSTHSKCVIFPKGKTTWEGFVPPCEFKDGDIIFTHANCLKVGLGNTWISIYQEKRNGGVATYVDYAEDGSDCYSNIDGDKPLLCMEKDILQQRLATEEEKAKLFDAIKSNGYKWDEETRTLVKLIKPKFKVGDRIKKNKDYISGIVTNISDDDTYKVEYQGGVSYVSVAYQDEWELVPNKFDINTLIPFESRVLVRNYSYNEWKVSLWGCLVNSIMGGFIYDTIRGCYIQCIPYEGNEHLLGKTDDCNEYFKTWE